MRDPVEIQIAVQQRRHKLARICIRSTPTRSDLLLHLLENDGRQTLVFAVPGHGADKLAKMLEKSGLESGRDPRQQEL